VTCPYCDYKFQFLAMSVPEIPSIAPCICEFCGQIGLLENGVLRQITAAELEEIKLSPAWENYLKPAQDLINKGVSRQ